MKEISSEIMGTMRFGSNAVQVRFWILGDITYPLCPPINQPLWRNYMLCVI